MDQGVTSPGDMSRFLRIAYYLFTVLSAVLTIGSLRGERFTLPTETYSAPLRSGASSPTFFNEVVMVGVLSSGIFCYFPEIVGIMLDRTSPDLLQ